MVLRFLAQFKRASSFNRISEGLALCMILKLIEDGPASSLTVRTTSNGNATGGYPLPKARKVQCKSRPTLRPWTICFIPMLQIAILLKQRPRLLRLWKRPKRLQYSLQTYWAHRTFDVETCILKKYRKASLLMAFLQIFKVESESSQVVSRMPICWRLPSTQKRYWRKHYNFQSQSGWHCVGVEVIPDDEIILWRQL